MVLYEPTELRYWNKERTYDGYTLFGAGGRSYLIDMEGKVVNPWQFGTNPRLLANGSLLTGAGDEPRLFQRFRELDWSGNCIWEYTETCEDYAPQKDSFVALW